MNVADLLCVFLAISISCSQSTDGSVASHADKIEDSTTPVPDDKWVGDAIKDVAYYLRAYRFNEWDRRYHQAKPRETNLIGYYSSFPVPALRSLHWKVYENCNSNFYKCIAYLHSIVESAPLTRQDDTATILNDNLLPMNDTLKTDLDHECKRGLESTEATGLPFDGPLEKFQWRTTASYYMCWYTMLETPALSMLEDQCDNFANCLDPDFGPHNRDPRSDDRVSFACAMYSFCPDPCCPLQFIKDIQECSQTEANPCFAENSANRANQVCTFNRHENRNIRDIIMNKWNVSCHCEENGFVWKSQFGMCVDINECVTGDHTCDDESEDCLNLPGSFTCICRWNYSFDNVTNKCVRKDVIPIEKFNMNVQYFSFMNLINRILKYIGLKRK